MNGGEQQGSKAG
jgi:hypothetical protein